VGRGGFKRKEESGYNGRDRACQCIYEGGGKEKFDFDQCTSFFRGRGGGGAPILGGVSVSVT